MVENELLELAAERGVGVDGLPMREARRLYLRLVPEVFALLAVALRDADSWQQDEIIDEFVGCRALWAERLGDITRDLSGLLGRYRGLVGAYDGWVPLPVISTLDDRVIQPWERRADGQIAADFVALRPQEFDPALGQEYAQFEADAEAAFETLDGWYAGAFIGMRVITSTDGYDLDSEWWSATTSDVTPPGLTAPLSAFLPAAPRIAPAKPVAPAPSAAAPS